MISQTNQSDLLKEYIKTFFASKTVFAGVLPRKWGKGFSDEELHEVYNSLKVVLKQADPYSRESLIREFEQFSYTPQHLRWYIRRFWHEIVELMAEETSSVDRLVNQWVRNLPNNNIFTNRIPPGQASSGRKMKEKLDDL